LWGPDAPTAKALKHRITVLKKLAGALDPNNGPQTVKTEGLLTPQSSPLKRPQKFEDEDPEEFTPRKLPKRTTRGAPKYKVEVSDGEDGELFAKDDDDDDDQADEWKPHTPAEEMELKTEVNDENQEMEHGFGNHHFEPNHYLQYF
jgi:hypothetical protein